tara:strand:- start:184 stop:588 length:405 start_codon:yes stop_codon:yes gene_type:complete
MPTTISKLKKKLDKVFSEYIRRRNADHLGFITCFTCSVKRHWKEQQAGHFQSRSHHSTRWDEINVQVQCVKCNMFRQGEQYKFGMYLDQKYGEGTAEDLETRSKTIVKLNRTDYEEAIERYKQKIRDLDQQSVV